MYFSQIKELIKEVLGERELRIPLNEKFGDLSLYLSKELPELNFDFIEKVEPVNNYLNIFIKKDILFESIISEIIKDEKREKKEKVTLEYLSPNTNKPLHLGHLRNAVIGMALANAFKELGYQTFRINIVNDRGEHICRSMLAYQKWGKKETPESMQMKGDHFVGYWYVYYSQRETPELKKEVHTMLKKWEEGDKETVALWQKMNKWVYQGFKETYQKAELSFDKVYYESDLYRLGKKIVKEGLDKGIFYRGEEGDILFDLPEEEFGLNKDGSDKKIILLRKDDTSVYLTQDLGMAVSRKRDYDFDRSIYVVGLEQSYHLKCLFFILKALGYSWADRCFHFPYGLVYLPEGKMKSREGKVVDIDDLTDKMQELAQKEISKRERVKDQDRSLKIALAALKFNLLSIQPKQEIHFDPKKSIAFEGKTGPYCQYSLVRALNILKEKELTKEINFSSLKQGKEIVLVRQLSLYPEIIQKSVDTFNPSLIANYIYEISKTFNQFYNLCPVLKAEEETIQARLALVKAFSIIMKKGLTVLNIPILEKM